MKLAPKNWLDLQHYKDRKPIWIKLHRELLNNYEFMMLQDDSKMLAPLLWLLASEYQDGIILAHPDKIAFRLHIEVSRLKITLTHLKNADFFEADAEFMGLLTGDATKVEQVASKMVQNACVETEKRREEKEKEREFTFSLGRATLLSNTSREYRARLEEYITSSGGILTYQDFYNQCEMKPYKYKNYKMAYDKWTSKESKRENGTWNF